MLLRRCLGSWGWDREGSLLFGGYDKPLPESRQYLSLTLMLVLMSVMMFSFWNPDWVREMTGCPETTKGVGVADHNCMKCNQIFMPMTVYTGSSTIMSPPKPTEI